MRRHDRELARRVAEVAGREHGAHARACAARVGVDRRDAGVGVRGPHEGGVEHAGERDVPDVAALSPEEPRVLLPQHAVADELHGRWFARALRPGTLLCVSVAFVRAG